MLNRPHAGRALRAARPLVVAALAAAALAACGAPVTLNTVSTAATPTTVLGCVAEVASERGLHVVERRTEGERSLLRAQSAPLSGSAQRVDVMTVSLAKIGQGLRVVAQTLRLRPAPARAQADGELWEAGAPSAALAEARDAVLQRCGSLGS